MTDESGYIPPTASPTPPPPAYVPPKPKSPFGPILVGFFTVIILSALLGFFYFKAKFQPDLALDASPSPSAMASASPSAEPSLVPAQLEPEPSSTTKGGVKPTLKPVSAIPPVKSLPPTLDIRFGNPSVNIKQTIDEGHGRVINREYTSLQGGTFDEVTSTWSPKVTVCYHLVSSENIPGKDVKFSFSLNANTEITDSLSQYDKLEAGKLYDWCHDTTTSIGTHTARMSVNGDKSIKESNYNNNVARLDWENLADKIAPNYTLTGPTNENDVGNGTCLMASYLSDNVTKLADLKIEIKQDGGAWQTIQSDKYCQKGQAGTSHSIAFRISDTRQNVNEQNKTFVLY